MEPFYRAMLRLERVEPYIDKYDSPNTRSTEISSHTVTGDTPADAMVQLCAHADSLHDWHVEQAGDEPMPLLDEAVKPGPALLGLDLSKVFQHLMGPQRLRCTICGTLGPIKHEGNTWICVDCNAAMEKKLAEPGQEDTPADIVERMRQAVAPPPFVDPAALRCSRCLQPFEPGHACAEPDTVQFHASDYADKLTFSATPSWLTAALETGIIRGTFRGEDYWYLEVRTPGGVVTAEPGDSIIRHFDGGLLVRSPEGLCKQTVPDASADDEPGQEGADGKCSECGLPRGADHTKCWGLRYGTTGMVRPVGVGPLAAVPALEDTEADRDAEMRAALVDAEAERAHYAALRAQHGHGEEADLFAHCHVPVGGGYCHRPYRHEGACSVHGDPIPEYPVDGEDSENNALLNAEADERDQASAKPAPNVIADLAAERRRGYHGAA